VRYPAAAPEPVTGRPTRRLAAAPWPAHSGGAGPAWRRTGRAALPAAVGLLVVVAVFLIGNVIEPGRAPHAGTVPSATPSSPGATGSRMVDVNLGALIGQPVGAAAHLLRQQGLAVHVRWRHSGGQPPGTVLSVRPAGPRPAGSLVTLTAALKPGHDGQGGDGQGGDGNGHHHGHPGENSGMD
jgi:hypothetical protein